MTLQVVPSSIRFASVSVSRDAQQSLPESADFVSTVGTPQLVPTSLKTWNMTDRHLMLLNGIACIVSVIGTYYSTVVESLVYGPFFAFFFLYFIFYLIIYSNIGHVFVGW